MNLRRIFSAALLVSLLAGCQQAVPMSYEQWKKETNDRLAFQRAGLQYKSPQELKDEAAQMRQLFDTTNFNQK